MNSRTLRLHYLVAAAILAPAGASPQGRGGPPAVRPGIDIATAKRAVAAAVAAATSADAHVAIAVVDINGDLVYFERMDGAAGRAVTSAQGKARAALLFGIPSKDVQEAVASGKPVSLVLTAPAGGAVEVTAQQGGVPIMKDGKVVAAIGAGGSAPAQDEKFAQAGVDAVTGAK